MSNASRINYTKMLSSGAIQAASVKFGKKLWVDPIAGIDVETEYPKVQAKQSTLSRRDRELVVLKWERMQSNKKTDVEGEGSKIE